MQFLVFTSPRCCRSVPCKSGITSFFDGPSWHMHVLYRFVFQSEAEPATLTQRSSLQRYIHIPSPTGVVGV